MKLTNCTDLDNVLLRYSYKFPTLLTLIVDGNAGSPGGTSPVSGRDPQEWRLPSADPREPGKYMYRLHTMDIYFWTIEDARSVLDTSKKLLNSRQLDVLDAPALAQQNEISPVVQQLENVAITDPAYRNGQTRNSQNQPQALPPPPLTSGTPIALKQPTPVSQSQAPKKEEAQQNFAPLAYNPAAPPAPEPIAHREDTPPPPDAADGTGLATAAQADHFASAAGPAHPHQPYTGIPNPAGQGVPPPNLWGASSAPIAPVQPSSYSSPPPNTMHHNPSISSTNSSRHQSVSSGYIPQPASTAPSSQIPQSSNTASPRPSVSFGPPQASANTSARNSVSSPPMTSPPPQAYNPAAVASHQPLQHVQPQYADYLAQNRPAQPLGGYSNYSYDQHGRPIGNPYDVHSQVYRPTESEMASHHRHHRHSESAGQKPGGLEDRVGKAEKTVNRFLKKLEKKL
ncbi:MAG: hypothetical protein Q9160_002559 [Pyrenula sp. 1 TL-2023]